MSRLDELIKEFCPDGVRYSALGDVSCYATKRIDVSEVNEDNYVGVENLLQNKQGKTTASTVPTTGNVIGFKAGDILIGNIRPYLRKIWLADCDGGTNGDVLAIQINDTNQLTPRFLYYILSSEAFFNYDNQNAKGAKMPRGDKSAVMKYILPVPPLPVQEEIVRILDTFTSLTAELQVELQARRKQYEYYCEKLMQFDNSVPYLSITKLFPNIRNGFVGTVTQYFTDEQNGIRYLEGTNIHNGIISDNEVLYVTKEFHQKHIKNELKPDDILMVQSGHIGECAVVGKKYAGANCHALIIMSNGGKCVSKFFIHYFHTAEGMKHLKPAITDGNLKHVLAGKMDYVKVPVPSFEEQKRISDILDRFEVLCNDISAGLPAEIAARQKQYEYYRDRLLSFKELTV